MFNDYSLVSSILTQVTIVSTEEKDTWFPYTANIIYFPSEYF